jgi:hypothetical protein
LALPPVRKIAVGADAARVVAGKEDVLEELKKKLENATCARLRRGEEGWLFVREDCAADDINREYLTLLFEIEGIATTWAEAVVSSQWNADVVMLEDEGFRICRGV